MKSVVSIFLLLISTNAFAAREINYWNGSGNSIRSENGVAWENVSCQRTVGLVVEKLSDPKGAPCLSIYGGLCNRARINVALKIDGNDLILTGDSFGFTAPWTSTDLNKTIGNFDGRSFHYKFRTTAPDTHVSFVYEGSVAIASTDPNSALISVSEKVVLPDGRTTEVVVTGSVKSN